jgi:hypothetical protein
MTVSPGAKIDVREEIDVVTIDPTFLETQRNRYASRGVALIVLLNGVAAIALLVALALGSQTADSADRFGEAMLVFGAGATAALASSFVAYLSRTLRLEMGRRYTWRGPLRWLAILAAVLSMACFLAGLNMARVAGEKAVVAAPKVETTQPSTPARSNPSP